MKINSIILEKFKILKEVIKENTIPKTKNSYDIIDLLLDSIVETTFEKEEQEQIDYLEMDSIREQEIKKLKWNTKEIQQEPEAQKNIEKEDKMKIKIQESKVVKVSNTNDWLIKPAKYWNKEANKFVESYDKNGNTIPMINITIWQGIYKNYLLEICKYKVSKPDSNGFITVDLSNNGFKYPISKSEIQKDLPQKPDGKWQWKTITKYITEQELEQELVGKDTSKQIDNAIEHIDWNIDNSEIEDNI